MDDPKEPKEEPLFDNKNSQDLEEDREVKEEEMSDDERESSHFAMSSFFSPARSVDRSRSLAPHREVKEEEIDEGSPMLERSLAEGTFDSTEDEKTKKSSQIGLALKANYKRKSSNGDYESEGASKKVNVSKENDTDLQCPECQYRTRSVSSWVAHLRNKHATTSALAGFALLCGCGRESLSDSHSRSCVQGSHTTVIHTRDGPIGRLGDEKATPQCVLCEAYPKTANGYARHLGIHHKSTPSQNGIYFLCSCGLKMRSSSGSSKHFEGCDPRQFTIHNLDNENDKSRSDSSEKRGNIQRSLPNKTELECPECEFRTRSAVSWVTHLRNNHSTTPALAGLALLCGCGYESLSAKHCKKTNHANTTVVRKRDGPIRRLDDKKETPKCVLCESHPKTAFGYSLHIERQHNSTLAQNGVYLKCSCGLEVRSRRASLKHLDDCDTRQFTIHKLDKGKPTTPQCVLCKMYPKTVTARGYASHLRDHHNSSLAQNGIFLICSCGIEVRGDISHLRHLDKVSIVLQ